MTRSKNKQRLDRLLVVKNMAPTRSRASDHIRDGYVSVAGKVIIKPGQLCDESAQITLSPEAPAYVSRSAVKLEHALEHFGVVAKGRIILDIGASTGGFTEILLEQGANHIYAIDVGHDQLHERLKNNPRVTSMEGKDARTLQRSDLTHEEITALTIDVSFISLLKAIEAPMQLLGEGSWIIALIKPQFEVGLKALGKGGVVRDEEARQEAVNTISAWFESQPGWSVTGTTASPIKGHAGNQEYLLCAKNLED